MEHEIPAVTEKTFDGEVLNSSVPVLVDFCAPWCAPCVALSPVLTEVGKERKERLRVVKVDIEQNGQLSTRYKVMSLPTLMLFEGGEVARTVVRPSGKSAIDDFLDADNKADNKAHNKADNKADNKAHNKDAVSAAPHAAPAKARALDPTDFVGVDAALDDDERLTRDTVRHFLRQDVLDKLPDAYENGYLPEGFPKAAGELGLLGMHLHGYGCAGTSAVAYGLACQELEAADSGLRSFVSVQGSLAMFAIHRFGSEEQRERWLPSMAAGETVGCFGLTEPDAGSDPSAMRTTARRDGDGWVLNGTKMWITNGGIATVAVVWARTDEGVRGFLVERGTPGFSTRDLRHKLSLRASTTSELVFEDCRVPGSAVLPAATSLRAPLSCLDEARFGILWGVVGAARACYQAALEYSGTRTVFGRPLSSFQLTQEKLVEMLTRLTSSQLLALRLGKLKDDGQLRAEQVSLGKLVNVRNALEIARSARTVLAANGITLEYPVMRHMNNLESVLTYEGTAEIHTLVLGKAITGENAFA